MGQQIPFQTLELVADGLRREDARRRGLPPGAAFPAPAVRSVLLDGERLARAEVRLARADGGEREVHVYEAYWAPLTEGQVRLRDVVAFLFRGAANGIVNAARKNGFRRWLFDEYRRFDVPGTALLSLLATLGVVLGLVALNGGIALAALVRTPLKDPPRWLGDGLFGDLSTVVNLVLTLAMLFAGSLLLSRALRRAPPASRARRAAGALSAAFFALAIAFTTLAGLSLPLLFWAHIRCTASGPDRELLPHALGSGFVSGFDRIFETAFLAFAAATLAAFLLIGAAKLLGAAGREWKAGGRRAATYALGVAAVAAIAAAFVGEIRAAAGFCRELLIWTALRRGAPWPILFLLSAWIRSLLVQYPGDVAAYVGSHTLDRFNDLRAKIKETVGRKARAVYGAREPDGSSFAYTAIAVVGHSLGSVVAYDTLNRLILDDEAAPAGGAVSLDAARRTRLLLTFGSPLDKTAFIFGMQGRATSEGREAMAAAVQPMICDYRFRPRRWVNIHSPWDIVSGPLDLYDLPSGTDARRIENLRDDDATTLIGAHLEYWRNALLFDVLHRELTA
ncbi:MAG: hypothetical protein ABI592_12230 [Acidobacteriota bacterium]